LDVPITDITVGGVSVTYYSGTNFPINSGDVGSFTTTNVGNYTIRVYYGTHIAGQNITVVDSSSVLTCCDLNPGGGLCLISGADLDTITAVQVSVSDGACS
jgi:hypothetical protein